MFYEVNRITKNVYVFSSRYFKNFKIAKAVINFKTPDNKTRQTSRVTSVQSDNYPIRINSNQIKVRLPARHSGLVVWY